MTKTFLGFALIALGMQFSTLTCSAQQAALPKTAARVVYAIRSEADEAQRNAAIYQWQRVNREVDRLVADARKLSAVAPASFSFDALQRTFRRYARPAFTVMWTALQRPPGAS